MAIFLTVYDSISQGVEYLQYLHERPAGTILDVAWTLPMLGGAYWAATWKPAEQKAGAEREAQTRAELEKVRQEAAQHEAEARRLRMENELARIAATKREARGFVVTLSSGLFFDTGKATLKKGAQATLTRIADQLKTDDKVKVTIEGHTDSVGTAEKNQQLSEKRAQAVRDYLVGTGLAADRLIAVGRGEEQPIATNKTAAGRQQNRRVELVITE